MTMTYLQRRQEAAARVARGAVLLDKRIPRWWEDINLDRLKLSSGSRCVLGQLFPYEVKRARWKSDLFPSLEAAMADYDREGEAYWTEKTCAANYDAGLVILGLDHQTAAHNGFVGIGDGVTHAGLDRAWAELIAMRKAVGR